MERFNMDESATRLKRAANMLTDYANLLSSLADNLPVRGVELMQESGEVKDLADEMMELADSSGEYKRGFIEGFRQAVSLTSQHFVETNSWDDVREILNMQGAGIEGERNERVV
ncbi:MAG: hypothetical protein NC080_07560 [Paraprevotella sp.]|nr:hypothetical protein [Paraprevotella sp.]